MQSVIRKIFICVEDWNYMKNSVKVWHQSHLLHWVLLYMKHLPEKNLKKKTSTHILDLAGADSRDYLFAHFYDEIRSVLAENYSTEIKTSYLPPYISEYVSNIVVNTGATWANFRPKAGKTKKPTLKKFMFFWKETFLIFKDDCWSSRVGQCPTPSLKNKKNPLWKSFLHFSKKSYSHISGWLLI